MVNMDYRYLDSDPVDTGSLGHHSEGCKMEARHGDIYEQSMSTSESHGWQAFLADGDNDKLIIDRYAKRNQLLRKWSTCARAIVKLSALLLSPLCQSPPLFSLFFTLLPRTASSNASYILPCLRPQVQHWSPLSSPNARH